MDPSGAHLTGRIAFGYLEKYPKAQTVLVKLTYAIGHPEALMAVAIVDGVPEGITGYDLMLREIKPSSASRRPSTVGRASGDTLAAALAGNKKM